MARKILIDKSFIPSDLTKAYFKNILLIGIVSSVTVRGSKLSSSYDQQVMIAILLLRKFDLLIG